MFFSRRNCLTKRWCLLSLYLAEDISLVRSNMCCNLVFLLLLLNGFRNDRKYKEISGKKNMINMIICFEDFVQSQAFLCVLFCFSFLLIHPCFFALPPSPFLPSFRYPSITFVLLFNHLIHFIFLSCSLLFRVFHFLCPTQGQGSFCSRGASWMLQTGSTRPRFCCTISRMPAGRG